MWTPLVKSLWPPWWWHGPQEFYPSEVFFPFYALTNIPAAGLCYYWFSAAIAYAFEDIQEMFWSNFSRLSVLVRFTPGIRLFCVLKAQIQNPGCFIFHFFMVHGNVCATLNMWYMGVFTQLYTSWECLCPPALLSASCNSDLSHLGWSLCAGQYFHQVWNTFLIN